MTVEGIDISKWQVATPPLGTSLEFVFVRATYGLDPDARFAKHANDVREAGKILGAYHFGRNGDGAAQARAFLNVIGPSVRLVALDFEKDGDNPKMAPGQARAFIRTVQATGRTCGLYASESGFPNDLGQDWRWVAKWGRDEPHGRWAFWQYASGSHHASGVDRDRFSGTMEQLERLAGVPDPSWTWERDPKPPRKRTSFAVLTVEHGVVVGPPKRIRTEGTAPYHCTPPKPFPWPGHRDIPLVHLGRRVDGQLGSLEDAWVHARWAKRSS